MSRPFSRFLGVKKQTSQVARPASQNQSRYVIAELAGAGSYMISMGHLVQGQFDATRFLAAARRVVKRHEALRTHFQFAGQEVQAIVAPEPRFQHEIEKFADTSLDRFRTWALPLVFDQVDPLEPGSLIRFVVADYGNAWRFTIAAHHAITDGFSRGVMNRELLKIYAGEEVAEASSYYEHNVVETESHAQLDNYVKSLPPPARIFSTGGTDAADDVAGQFVERDFTALSRPLRSMAKTTRSTRFAVMSAIYALSLSGQTNTHRLSSFFQSEGRKAVGASNAVVGPFSNTMPLDLSFDPKMPFCDFAQAMSLRVKDVLALETQPMMALLAAHDRLPTVSLNQYPPAPRISAGALEVGPRELLDRRTEYDLNLVWTDDSGRLAARAFYNPAMISAARVDLFLSLYEAVLRCAVNDPAQSCEKILAEAKSDRLAVFPRVGVSSQPKHRLHDAFFDLAREDPQALALVTTTGRVTRGTLLDRAMAYRTALGDAGARAGDRVAILTRRCPDMVAALLGVSASGASFALIDGTYPAARIETMLDTFSPAFLIVAGEAIPEINIAAITHVLPDTAGQSLSAMTGPPRDAAYHLFTSGTTGTPKLVTHPETTVQRFIKWQTEWLAKQSPKPVTMMMSGPSHDPVMRDILLPLSTGGSIAVPTEEEMSQPCGLRALCTAAGVTVLHLTPASGRLLALGAEQAAFSQIHAIVWGGDRLLAQQSDLWHCLAPAARQLNLYGASETPQAALIHAVDPERPTETKVPVGRPTAWTGARLLGRDGRVVALGEIGEIVIELDAPVVGARPSAAIDGVPSHATGDYGYAMPDGIIRYIGRSDRQMQINGYRIELAEIQAAAENLDGVIAAAALIGGPGRDQIHLFVAHSAHKISEARLRAALARSLPSHMLPTKVTSKDRLPVSQNGKVDHDALGLEMDDTPRVDQADIPSGDDEIAVAAIFARFAGVTDTRRTQSLTDLGADSLSVIEIRLALEADGFELPEGWEWMPISTIAQQAVRTRPNDTKSRAFFAPVRLDTWMLIRCLAIVLIVFNHAGRPMLDGASILLITLAGFSFGQMQLPAIVKDGRTGRIWAQVAKLLIPLVPASLVIYSILTLIGKNPHPAALLFYQNLMPLIDNQMLGTQIHQHQIMWLWFLHAYLQIFVGLGLLLAVPRILGWVRDRSWSIALLFFGFAWVLMLASYIFVLAFGKDASSVAADSAIAPTSILPFFALGLLFALAETHAQKLSAALIAVLHFAVMKWGLNMHGEVLWLVGLAFCLGVRSLFLPRLIAVSVTAISAQSLMIYLSHMPVIILMTGSLSEKPPILVLAAVAICVGVVLGNAIRPIYRILGVHKLAEKKVVFRFRNRANLSRPV